jgi:hypothetical protein
MDLCPHRHQRMLLLLVALLPADSFPGERASAGRGGANRAQAHWAQQAPMERLRERWQETFGNRPGSFRPPKPQGPHWPWTEANPKPGTPWRPQVRPPGHWPHRPGVFPPYRPPHRPWVGRPYPPWPYYGYGYGYGPAFSISTGYPWYGYGFPFGYGYGLTYGYGYAPLMGFGYGYGYGTGTPAAASNALQYTADPSAAAGAAPLKEKSVVHYPRVWHYCPSTGKYYPESSECVEGWTEIPQIPEGQEAGYWYHCEAPKGYYPYVRHCEKSWSKRSPTRPQ